MKNIFTMPSEKRKRLDPKSLQILDTDSNTNSTQRKGTMDNQKIATEMMERIVNRVAAFTLGKPDKKVIDAFLDKKKGSSRKMETDGKTLDINGMGGKGVAKWVGGKIDFGVGGSRSRQTVQNYLRKNASYFLGNYSTGTPIN